MPLKLIFNVILFHVFLVFKVSGGPGAEQLAGALLRHGFGAGGDVQDLRPCL